MTTLVTSNEVRICAFDAAEYEDLAYALEAKGVNCSFQWNGEVDEQECKIMEYRPLGNWEFYHDMSTNEYVLKIKD